jgi:AGCS family alanine or glycine:cation symporter
LYQIYAVVAFVAFSFLDTTLAQSVMAIAGGLLLVMNSVGIFLLRRKISFNLPKNETEAGTVPIPELNS